MEILSGIIAKHWVRLLKENRISFRFSLSALFLTFKSLYNAKIYKKEQKYFNERIAETKIEQEPIFILGHWRSGTTLLHNYLSQDERFAYPNLFEIYNPFTFLYLEPILSEKLKKVGSQKRPMDNVVVDYKTPGEDEFALALLSLRSPMLAWCFPKRENFYDQFLTFDDVNGADVNEWKDALLHFVKKLTFKYNRPLVLKSPPHTARVRLLLQVFPNAKFIHIYRNPYKVFLSTQNLYSSVVKRMSLQNTRGNNNSNIVDGILHRYKKMYDKFFEDKKLIPSGHFIELPFEQFVKEPIHSIQQIYHQLDFPNFEKAKEKLIAYQNSISDYAKNKYDPPSNFLRKKIVTQWAKSFETWGYDP